jgi:hypothetical protein
MATSTIVQRLVAGEGESFGNRREVETFLGSSTFAAKDWVALDRTKTDEDRCLYVTPASGTVNPFDVIGVALDACSVVGSKVRVVISGYVEGANVQTGVPAGAAIYISGSLTGRASNIGETIITATAFSGSAGHCGVTLEAAASNTADVRVIKRF